MALCTVDAVWYCPPGSAAARRCLALDPIMLENALYAVESIKLPCVSRGKQIEVFVCVLCRYAKSQKKCSWSGSSRQQKPMLLSGRSSKNRTMPRRG